MTTSPTDGRLLKGELRRQELIEATLQVVAREGVAGVSHRAVAREANQPAAAYYFKSIDDLLTAALTVCVDQDAERMRRLAESADGSREGLTALAELLASVMGGPGRLLAEYELYLPAARRPELRTSTGRWLDAIADTPRATPTTRSGYRPSKASSTGCSSRGCSPTPRRRRRSSRPCCGTSCSDRTASRPAPGNGQGPSWESHDGPYSRKPSGPGR